MAYKSDDVSEKESSAKHWASYAGDCPCVNRVLASRNTKLWTVFKFINALLRAFGQVIFCNNPISGLFVLIAVIVAQPCAALGGLLSGIVAVIAALLLEQHKEEVAAGRTASNSVLLGIVTLALARTQTYDIGLGPKLWVSIIFASVFCVYVSIALTSLLFSLPRLRLPCLQAPFVITQTLLLFCLLHSAYPDVHHAGTLEHGMHPIQPVESIEPANLTVEISPESLELSTEPPLETTTFIDLNNLEWNKTELFPDVEGIDYEGHHMGKELNWGEVLAGVILSSSRVLSIHSVPSAVLLYFAILIFSPLSASFALIGSIIATVAGVIFSESPEAYHAVYEGSWGCQGLLCAMVIGGIYYVLTWQSAVAACACAFFAAVVRHFIGDPEFMPPSHNAPSRLPLLTLPFVLSALLFLCLTSVGDGFLRPSHLSSPEQQYVDYRETYGKCARGKGKWGSMDSSRHSSHEAKCPLAEPEDV
ncbi:urea transporter 2-like [Ischnura elegans]|uniref:urea transporter 2-like n=1 Tax=Ischnura elegans TaxID=197161 RepID=UPI001ED898FB|nr:urea transporter 2-like [Ischnura elegans]